MKLAPIVLFVYSRPWHTEQTLLSLMNNELADQSELFIYADGLKPNATEEQAEAVKAVRDIIHSKKWCGKVTIIESDINKGLAQSIKQGVTEVLDKYGSVIVLEDDLKLSPAFLSYMNKALKFYEQRQSVFSIGGYNYPPSKMQIPTDYQFDTYVCLRNNSWGWATWKNRWQQVDWQVQHYDYVKNNPYCKAALNRMGDDEFELLQAQQEKGLNIWSVQFTMAHFVNHAVAIYPCVSYVKNIGLDGSGENCGTQRALNTDKLNENTNPSFVDILYEDSRIINAFYNVNCRKKRPLWQKGINYICRKLNKKPPFVLKGKVYIQ